MSEPDMHDHEEQLRILEESKQKRHLSARDKSEGAEKWLYKPIRCLDHGHVYLVDYMGNDSAVEQAARVSYGRGTRKVSKTRGLVRYLRRHHHTTPFEMVEVKFRVMMPIFVARQWVRHRTANINEYSGRYSLMPLVFYTPENRDVSFQSSSNRQGREDGSVSEDLYKEITERWENLRAKGAENYNFLVEEEIARELARIDLPISIYTQWYWKIDLHNLMHFLRLRMDSHAQREIRVYAEAMATIVKDAFPLSYEAFEDYALHASQLSRWEKDFLKRNAGDFPMIEEEFFARKTEQLSKREMRELCEKLKELDFIVG